MNLAVNDFHQDEAWFQKHADEMQESEFSIIDLHYPL